LLYLDNRILTKGEAFTNVNTQFYPSDTIYNNYYTYSSPYNQIIADNSIPNATIMTGVYVNNTFIGTGQSGFHSIDYNNGRLYFTTELPANTIISGSYAIKEYNVTLTSFPEETLLFETSYSNKPKTDQTATGASLNSIQYPIVFIRSNSMTNEPFTFGGTDNTRNYIRLIIMSDSQFSNDAINSIIIDSKNSYMPIFNTGQFPYNYLGHATNYNYTGITANSVSEGNCAFIEEVDVAQFNSQIFSQQFREVNLEVYSSIIDFQVVKPRNPRQS
jgi:hypothetical protein